MKKAWLRALGACLVLFALVSCGGGGGGGGDATPTPTPTPTPTTGTITGTVNNAGTGGALQGITVTAGAANATTDANGAFTLSSVSAGSAVVLFNSTTFAEQSKTVTVTGGATSSVNVLMVPVALTQVFNPAQLQALAVAGTTAVVNLPANSLRTATGATPTGNVTARITPISPAANPNLMPGEFTVSAGGGTSQIESFGALAATFTDANGNVLTQLASGQTATIRIPVSTRSTTTLPSTIPLMFFNPSTGMWVQEGTATLMGTAPNQFYEGTVTHFTTWNADQVYNTANVTVCVVDSAGQPVSGARVTSEGIDYTGTGSGTTNSQGSAVVAMKRSGNAAFTATSGTRVSNTVSITTSNATFTQSTCLVLASANTGNVTIKLTWGTNPSDLDSHLVGPNSTHVSYLSLGNLTATPFARLDVDDVTSFGPEVVTISRLATNSTYRYYVHLFSGSGTQTASPARVEVRSGSQTQIFSPGSGETTGTRYWHVFNIVVDSGCNVTIQTVNTFLASPPTATGTATYCNTTVQPSKLELDDYAAQVERAKATETDVKP